jgi:hypothetical protein
MSERNHFGNGGVLTRDNLSKRRKLEDGSYLFCVEQESIDHFLFGCVVARQLCDVVFECVNVPDCFL